MGDFASVLVVVSFSGCGVHLSTDGFIALALSESVGVLSLGRVGSSHLPIFSGIDVLRLR